MKPLKIRLAAPSLKIDKPVSKLKLISKNTAQAHPSAPPAGIAIASSEGLEIIKLEHISHCKAEGSYCKVVASNGRSFLASKTLKTIESAICSDQFIRVHQSYLVNLKDIISVFADGLVLEGGMQIPISRRMRALLMEKLQQFFSIV